MTDPVLLAEPFPAPPGIIATVLDELRIAAAATDETEHEARRVALLPRPWEPSGCPPEIRRNVYGWLDEVVAWINEQHTWRTDRVIPICWDLHPHIVHELATVTCLRWEATFARTPAQLEEWHRVVLPGFLRGHRGAHWRDRLPTRSASASSRRCSERPLSPGRRGCTASSSALGRGCSERADLLMDLSVDPRKASRSLVVEVSAARP